MRRLTIRQRIALWFTIGFILMGTIVRMIVFWRLDQSLSDLDEPAEIAALEGFDEFDVPIDRRPEDVTLADGRTLREVIEVAQQDFRDDTLVPALPTDLRQARTVRQLQLDTHLAGLYLECFDPRVRGFVFGVNLAYLGARAIHQLLDRAQSRNVFGLAHLRLFLCRSRPPTGCRSM